MRPGHRTAEGYWRNEPASPVTVAVGSAAVLIPLYPIVAFTAFSIANGSGLPAYSEGGTLFTPNDSVEVASLAVLITAILPALLWLSVYPAARRSYNESYRTRQVDDEEN